MLRGAQTLILERYRLASFLGLTGLYAFSLSIGASTAGGNLALGLVTIALLLRVDSFWRDAHRLPVFWLMVLLTGYVVVQSYWMISLHPVLRQASNPSWTHVVQVTGLVSAALAWWMGRYPRHVPYLLAVAAAGILIGIARASSWHVLLQRGLFSARHAWGGATPGGVTYLSGLVLVGASVTCLRSILYGDLRRLRTWIVIVSAAVLTLTAAVPFIGSQTRGAWIAGSVVVAGYVALSAARLAIRGKRLIRLTIMAAFIVAALATALLSGGIHTVERRMSSAPETVDATLSLNEQALLRANHSLGARVKMWVQGIEALKEQPLFGWGVGSKRLVQAQEDITIGGKGHYHNLYVEILVDLGLVGFTLFAATLALMLRHAIKYRFSPAHASAVFPLLMSLTAFSAITLLSDVRIGHPHSRAAIIMLMALMLSAAFAHRHQSPGTPPAGGNSGKACVPSAKKGTTFPFKTLMSGRRRVKRRPVG